jgi:hypothetical protein
MKERLLCTLPMPEPKEILDRIRDKYPDMDVEYITQAFVRGGSSLPAGVYNNHILEKH